MIEANTTFTSTGAGMPIGASDGDTVTYSLPAGCVLRRLIGGDTDDVVTVVMPSPFVHSGPDDSYQVHCVSYLGSPLTARLKIS